MRGENRFDATALKDFSKCEEFYRNRHELALRVDVPKGSPEAGNAIHSGLDVWFSDEGLSAARAAVLKRWGPDPVLRSGKKTFTGGYLASLLEGYAKRWPREADPWRVLASEDYVEYNFGPFVYCGLRDRVVEDDAGGRYLMDTKCSSLRLDEGRKQQFGLSAQFMGYQAMEEAEGQVVDGVILDYIQFDKRSWKIKPEHFQRVTLRFNAEHIEQWHKAAEWRVAKIKELRETLGTTRRWPQDDARCFDFFRPCEYLERCQVGASEADYVGSYREEVWDPKTLRSKE